MGAVIAISMVLFGIMLAAAGTEPAMVITGAALFISGGVWAAKDAYVQSKVMREANQQRKALARAQLHGNGYGIDWNFTPDKYWSWMHDNVPSARREAQRRLYDIGIDMRTEADRIIPAPPHLLGWVAGEPPPTYAAPLLVAAAVTLTAPTAAAIKATEVLPVFFKDGEPTTLSEYAGQEHVTTYLQALVDGTPEEEVNTVAHQLYCGPAGIGKTLLARAWVNTWNQRNERLGFAPVRFIEVFPADIPDLKSLDRVVREASLQPSVMFIDEIHDLTDRHTLKLYMLMEDGRYKFEDEAAPVLVPNVRIDGATTDYGALHPALKRRFNRHMLEPLTKAQIYSIVESRTFPITPDACELLVSRTHFGGAPWEALQLFAQAKVFARARTMGTIEACDVETVFKSQRIDELGLRWMDRKVIEVLLSMPRTRNKKGGGTEFVCFGASENDLCVMSQIDKGEYRETVKPRLMSRRLLQIRPTYGQALLPRAVQLYGPSVNRT